MAGVKISTILDEKIWKKFKAVAEESNRSISNALEEAVADWTARKNIRSGVIKLAEKSMQKNRKLLELLAK